MSRSYRGKFLIGVYSLIQEGETLLALCDNVKEFASFLKTSESSARVILQNIYKGKIKYVVVNHKFATVELIEENE